MTDMASALLVVPFHFVGVVHLRILTVCCLVGPIVRTSPWELSIRDPAFYDQLYVVTTVRKTNMWPRGREGNGFDGTFPLYSHMASFKSS